MSEADLRILRQWLSLAAAIVSFAACLIYAAEGLAWGAAIFGLMAGAWAVETIHRWGLSRHSKEM